MKRKSSLFMIKPYEYHKSQKESLLLYLCLALPKSILKIKIEGETTKTNARFPLYLKYNINREELMVFKKSLKQLHRALGWWMSPISDIH